MHSQKAFYASEKTELNKMHKLLALSRKESFIILVRDDILRLCCPASFIEAIGNTIICLRLSIGADCILVITYISEQQNKHKNIYHIDLKLKHLFA